MIPIDAVPESPVATRIRTTKDIEYTKNRNSPLSFRQRPYSKINADFMRTLELMVIDDDPMFPLLLEHGFSKFYDSIELRIFRDGLDALQNLKSDDKHSMLIFLDLYTMGMDGRDFIVAYKKEFRDGPRSIIYTATVSVDPADLRLADSETYLSGCICKPLVDTDIKGIVGRHLNSC